MFAVNNYAKIWNHEDKGRSSIVNMSTSRKDRETGEYKNDFSSKYVRFVGKAHDKLADLQDNGRILITECGVTVEPGNDGKYYTTFKVFDFENANSATASASKTASETDQWVAEEDDDLPY